MRESLIARVICSEQLVWGLLRFKFWKPFSSFQEASINYAKFVQELSCNANGMRWSFFLIWSPNYLGLARIPLPQWKQGRRLFYCQHVVGIQRPKMGNSPKQIPGRRTFFHTFFASLFFCHRRKFILGNEGCWPREGCMRRILLNFSALRLSLLPLCVCRLLHFDCFPFGLSHLLVSIRSQMKIGNFC